MPNGVYEIQVNNDVIKPRVLKDWRAQIAKRSRRKPYQVLHDRTLVEIASLRPDSHAALEEINGIGPAKLKRYGDALLDLVDLFSG